MPGLLSLHLFALGLWGGCVLVELVLEVGGRQGAIAPDAVAWLHRTVDRAVELPIIALVVGTGLLLWHRTGWDPALWPKVGLAGVAIGANLYCWRVVEERADTPARSELTTRVFGSAFVGVPFALVALYLGGARVGWW